MNPFHDVNTPLMTIGANVQQPSCTMFDQKVRQLAKKYLN